GPARTTAGLQRDARAPRKARNARTARRANAETAFPPSAAIAGKTPATTATQDGIMLGQSTGALAVSSGRAGAGVNGAGPARTASRISGGAASCASATPSTIVVSTAAPASIPLAPPPGLSGPEP